ncbi:MAG: glycosyltransferase family 2 protein [Armatimonadetes bacterium]|nr:glycosyltransferase family 2 protein [Armatimonadota bacterium]
MGRPHLAVIVPAYNEEPRLADSLGRIREYLDSQAYTWTVLVISDGSTDRTPDIAKRFTEEDERFELIEYRPNRGKGYAVRTGMLTAEADWLLLCDADLAAPIEEVEKLFAAATPVAIGSRALSESQLEIHQPKFREMAGRLFNGVVRVLGVPGLKDTQCGFKLFSYDAAAAIFPRCRLNGYSYDFEALMLARALGFEITEVPIRWSHQEGSKVRLIRDGFRMLRDLAALRLTFRSRLRDPKDMPRRTD